MDQRDSKDSAGSRPAPSGAPTPACSCEQPVPKQTAERKGSAGTICARCGLPVPIRFAR